MKEILLIGAGGHCRAVMDIIQRSTDFQIKGLLDPSLEIGTLVDGFTVLGGDELIPEYAAQNISLLITIGQLESPDLRRRIASRLESVNATEPTIICSSAVIAISAQIGSGTVVFPRAVIGANVQIGKNCILNTGSVIEHDSSIGDHTHVSTSTTINGGCRIGTSCFIGSGAVVKQSVSIADRCVVGACSFVNRDLTAACRVVGVPARAI